MLSITKNFTFEAAHQLEGECFGKCQRLHGHTYKLSIEISAPELKDSMVMNFAELKSIVKRHIIDHCDHSLLNDKFFQPTAENLCLNFAEILQDKLPAEITLESVHLWETPDSFATWKK